MRRSLLSSFFHMLSQRGTKIWNQQCGFYCCEIFVCGFFFFFLQMYLFMLFSLKQVTEWRKHSEMFLPVNTVWWENREESYNSSNMPHPLPHFLWIPPLSLSLRLFSSHPWWDYRYHRNAADWLGNRSGCGCHGNTHMLVLRFVTAVGVCRKHARKHVDAHARTHKNAPTL